MLWINKIVKINPQFIPSLWISLSPSVNFFPQLTICLWKKFEKNAKILFAYQFIFALLFYIEKFVFSCASLFLRKKTKI